MAHRRSIIARTKLFYQQQQRICPSFSHISSSDREEFPSKSSILRNSEIRSRFLITRNNAGNSLLSGNVSRLMRSTIQAGHGLIFHRNLSKVPFDTKDLNGVIGAVGDKTVEAAAPVVNEVAIAATDSFAFQYLIDYVHFYTGFQWWAAIAVTTFLIRFIQLPILINVMKFRSKQGTRTLWQHYRQHMVDIREVKPKICREICRHEPPDVKQAGPFSITVRRLPVDPLFHHSVSCIVAYNLFLAILNMAEKVPSFGTGGTLWFMDLTTPDHSMRLPILVALTLWLRLKLNSRKRFLDSAPTCKNENMGFAGVAMIGAAVTADLPSAISCYVITSNLFSIAFAIVMMMDPRVPKALGILMKPAPTLKYMIYPLDQWMETANANLASAKAVEAEAMRLTAEVKQFQLDMKIVHKDMSKMTELQREIHMKMLEEVKARRGW